MAMILASVRLTTTSSFQKRPLMRILLPMLALTMLIAAGCSKPTPTAGTTSTGNAGDTGATPVFSLAWSEYPSWSVFGVAHEKAIIDGEEGKLGPIEEKWGVDIVLKEADYDTCLAYYGASETDAVCITNMDTLAPSLSRDSVAILPTSTSVGADACIAVGMDDLDALKDKPTYGLEMSVSQYCFERNLELQGRSIKDFPFKNMDPGAAAQAMQTNQEDIQSIMVWNPFVLQTLRTRDGAKVLFDSSTIPEEIIDMVVIGKDALSRDGGEAFAGAVIETFYEINRMMADPATGDETLIAIGEKFSSLQIDDMKEVVKQTRFYGTPDAALTLLSDEKFKTETMPAVVSFCESHGIVEKKPTVGFNDDAAQLNFTTKFIEAAKSGQ
jgi:NitT/TauT family transport system substrate-binding protein